MDSPSFHAVSFTGLLSVSQRSLGVAIFRVIACGIKPCQVVMSFREVRDQAQGLLVIVDSIGVKLLLGINIRQQHLVRGKQFWPSAVWGYLPSTSSKICCAFWGSPFNW